MIIQWPHPGPQGPVREVARDWDAAQTAAREGRRLRSRRIARSAVAEPTLQFAAIGLVLFLLAGAKADATRTIRVTGEDIERISKGFQQQFGSPPSPAQARRLLAAHVSDELAFREGLALGLGDGDEVIRRRIVQKYHFLNEDLALEATPSRSVLQRYYEMHGERYQEPAAREFDHIYFMTLPAGQAAGASKGAGEPFRSTQAPRVSGDVFPLAVPATITQDEAAVLFGDRDFALRLFRAPLARWVGPYRSGFGWHYLRVTAERAARRRSFAEAESAVRADYRADLAAAEARKRELALRSKYRIELP